MQKQLVFDGGGESTRVFTALHLALRFGRNHVQSAPGKAVIRQERTIFRALEDVSDPDPVKSADLCCQKCGHTVMPQDTRARVLKRGGGHVVLEQQDVELLMERIDKGLWAGDSAIDMADAYDFLSAAPQYKPES